MEKLFTDFACASSGASPRGSRDGQPVIGLSVNIAEETSRLHEAYVRAVLDAGAVPLLIPATTDADALRRMVETIDGLILTGGADIAGEYFGEQTHPSAEVLPFRDAYDFLLLRLAVDRQLPILGICRGMQVIDVAFGGDIWQDIPSQYTSQSVRHSVLTPRAEPCHQVNIWPGTVLGSVLGSGETGVNSRHHQAVRGIADGFRVSAVSTDGIVEAIEAYPNYRIMGVQWHPENMAAEGDDGKMKKLFRFFVSEAELFARAKRIHRKYLTVDSHCDTPMLFAGHDINIGRRGIARVDIPKMVEGMTDAVFMAAYIPQGPLDDAGRRTAWKKATEILCGLKCRITANAESAGQAVRFSEADTLKVSGRKAIFFAVENGYAIGKEISNLKKLRDRGVVYMTLCHNGANDICDSAVGEPIHGGLSAFGREVVAEMNRLGMVIDLSHAAESTFHDVLQTSTQPVICSHSSARALCDHPRNLTDDQILATAAKGGVVQICLYEHFLCGNGKADIMTVIRHIENIINLAGTECVGIGSDFDGGGGVPGCNGANEIINITVELLRRGHGEETIAKILGGNLRRVVDSVQGIEKKETIYGA